MAAAITLDGADCSWPSAEELKKAEEIRKSCASEIAALKDPTRDTVGDVRLCRFLRFSSGKVPDATENYRKFLNWRVREDIETLRKGVVDLAREEFIAWLDSVRSPYAPPASLDIGETQDGHFVIFATPGDFKASDFVKKRPSCQTMDTDLLIVYICVEWLMRQIDDRSYEKQRMCYAIKVADMTNLGRETLPIFVPEIRRFAQNNFSALMSLYPEHDILILVLNAPFITRIVLAFATTLMSKRQASRIKVFSDAKAAEPQALMKHLLPLSSWPNSVGGGRANTELGFPVHDERRVAEFMARKEVTVARGVSVDISAFKKKNAPGSSTAEKAAPASTAGKEDEKVDVAMVEDKPTTEAQKAADTEPVPKEAAHTTASDGPVHEVTPVKMEEASTGSSSWFCCSAPA